MSTNSHVVFSLKNSRYDFEKVQRKKPVGFIAPTYPLFIGKEEELLVEELCKTAMELGLEIIALNFSGDHVHAIIRSNSPNISRIMMLWKGKTAYSFNRLLNQRNKNNPAIKSGETRQGLWAKSYYQKILKSDEAFNNAINYINNNRIKHGLPPLPKTSIERIENVITNI